MLKVAIIGCGLVSDQHVAQIRHVRDCEIVAVCDQEPLMAQQLASRFEIAGIFSDASEMLRSAAPHVVHITTPAQSHYSLGRLCLGAGCHVYMEKPFTVQAPEAEELIDLAESKGLLMTAGHNLQFNPEAIRMRERVKAGALGGPPLHIQCMQCFTHAEGTYGDALLGDRTHWVRSLPGSLLQNLISHGIAKIAEFLSSDRPKVLAHAYSSPYLEGIAQGDIVDELRAIIRDSANLTAHFTFSTQLGGATNQMLLHGRQGSILVDSTDRLMIELPRARYKSYLRFFLRPRAYAREYKRNSWRNIRQFVKKDFHMDYGMKMLIQSFYDAVKGKGPLPIPYRQILATARIMDSIFCQIRKGPCPS